MLATPRSDDAASRTLSLLLVLVLHALLLFTFLHFMVTPYAGGKPAPERLLEMIIPMTRPRAPTPAPARPSKPAPALPHQGNAPLSVMPSYVPPATAPDVTGLGQALFDCAPENIPNLTPDQRAHCTNGIPRPDNDAVLEPKSHVQDPARRAAEMRTKNTPGHIPCATMISGHTGGGDVPVPGADPICVLGGLINGFGPLNGLDK
jgi:hypothetical protein